MPLLYISKSNIDWNFVFTLSDLSDVDYVRLGLLAFVCYLISNTQPSLIKSIVNMCFVVYISLFLYGVWKPDDFSQLNNIEMHYFENRIIRHYVLSFIVGYISILGPRLIINEEQG